MGHELENVGVLDTLGLLGKSAWHGLGTIIDDAMTAVQAGIRFGMFWSVEGWKLEAIAPDGRRIEVPTHVANVRTSDAQGQPISNLLGVVGREYAICQNRELAEFTDALAQTGKVTIETCGSLRGGKRVWFLARGEAFDVGGKDTVYPYISVANGHDGTLSIYVTPTSVRKVCSNTFHLVVPSADNVMRAPRSAAIVIRHSGKIANKLEEAKRALAHYHEVLARNVEMFEAMQAQRVTQEQAMKLFASTYASYWETADAADLASSSDAVRKLAERRMERMTTASEAFMTRWTDEQTKLGIGSTVWSAFNAMTGFIQHDTTARGSDDTDRVSRRMESNLFGLNASRTHEVLASSLAMAA